MAILKREYKNYRVVSNSIGQLIFLVECKICYRESVFCMYPMNGNIIDFGEYTCSECNKPTELEKAE